MTGHLLLSTRNGDLELPVAEWATDHDQISASGSLSASLAESRATIPVRESGDVERVTTAFGAFRRVPRDGRKTATLTPPTALAPPFQTRDVFVLNFELTPISPTRYQWNATFGLEEPRPRDPIAIGEQGDPTTLDTQSVSVVGGASESLTLSGPAPSTAGDYLATAESPSTSDQALIQATPADATTLSFPGAGLILTERQIGPLDRGQDGGRETVTLPLRLDATQAAKLFAVGSRVDGATLRTADGAQNYGRDTVPNDELTASVSSPSNIPLSGEWVLRGWSVEVPSTAPRDPFIAEVELLDLDAVQGFGEAFGQTFGAATR